MRIKLTSYGLLTKQSFEVILLKHMSIYIYIYTQKNTASNTEQVLKVTPDKVAAIRPPTTHHENYQS